MAERIVSPGVFTRENDLSFLSQGIGEIGAAFIGPFKQGPAFVPTIVRTQSEFEDIFGTPDGTYYTEYAVQNYLREAGQATIVRVAGITGYSQIGPLGIFASGSGADDRLIGVLYSSNTGDEAVQISGSIASNPSSVGRFQINISGSGGNNIITPISASIVPADANDLSDIYGEAVIVGAAGKPVYTYVYFENSASLFGTYTTGSVYSKVLPTQDYI